MGRRERVHDRAILDALEKSDVKPFDGSVWRTTVKGRDPLRGSTASGRWNPSNEFEVLYTSLEKAGSLAEIGYRLSLEPVWPRMEHQIHRLRARAQKVLYLTTIEKLEDLGVEPERYQTFDYGVTQAISAAAHFLECDGLLVPGARHPSTNLVVFMDQDAADSVDIEASEDVDWAAWRRNRGRRV